MPCLDVTSPALYHPVLSTGKLHHSLGTYHGAISKTKFAFIKLLLQESTLNVGLNSRQNYHSKIAILCKKQRNIYCFILLKAYRV
jgi:hypothetical protein